MNCEFCQSPAHVWFQCPKKPEGWKPVRLAKESTAADSNIGVGGAILGFETQAAGVKGNCPAVDTNPSATNEGLHIASSAELSTSLAGVEGDKTGTKFNKVEYMRLYMRRRRAKAKDAAK